jgi:type II secretory ATPase GspE/PulE/Tfp pilus assembly ATPase PilB-like protein
MSEFHHPSHRPDPLRSDITADQKIGNSAIDHEGIFQLIKLVLSLESCLHYRVLPLKLQNNRLVLGMVNPKDVSAFKFVRSIVNSLGYGVDIKAISFNTHQSVLAAYLKYIGSSKQPVSTKADLDSTHTLTEAPEKSGKNQKSSNLHDRPTLIIDRPEEFPAPSENQVEQVPNFDSVDLHKSDFLESQSANFRVNNPDKQQIERLEDLRSTPEQLWQEIMNRLLDDGIGRLYLQRLSECGRIFCSQDGEIKFSLERVPLGIYQSILDRVKALAKLPPVPLESRKKLALEKIHRQERLLLRLEIFPGQWGEEATIQVLRGKALNFYEQRQVKKMAEQAVSLALKLEKTIKQMHAYLDSTDTGDLAALQEIQQKINKHLKLFE